MTDWRAQRRRIGHLAAGIVDSCYADVQDDGGADEGTAGSGWQDLEKANFRWR